jgi:hypothetical protein
MDCTCTESRSAHKLMALRNPSALHRNSSRGRERKSKAGNARPTVHVELGRETATLHEALEAKLDLSDPNDHRVGSRSTEWLR